jgi:hypothetical protein
MAAAGDKDSVEDAVKRVAKLLAAGGSKQKKNFEKRINPDLKGKVSSVITIANLNCYRYYCYYQCYCHSSVPLLP